MAIASTIVAILIGAIGSIASVYAMPGSAAKTMWEFVGIKFTDNLLPKIIILVLAVALLIYNILTHIKAVKSKEVKYELEDKEDVLLSEVKAEKNTKAWPLYTVLGIVLLFLILGLVPWQTLFPKFDAFDKFHEWLMGLKIGKGDNAFVPFAAIITTYIPSFGNWLSVGFGYIYLLNMFIILTLVALKFTFRVKFDDLISNFIEGAKKILPAALMAILVYSVYMVLVNTGDFYGNLLANVLEGLKGFNLAVSSVFTMIGAMLNIDFINALSTVYQPILTHVGELSNKADVLPVLEIMFQSLHYLVMLIAPTSVMLVVGLVYLNVPYKTWLKFIWKLFLELFIVIFAVLMIILLV